MIRRFGAAYVAARGASLTFPEERALRELAACRTAALGGHGWQCDDCGHFQAAYNSCRNRHCPKCQGGARAAWLEARQEELLPAPYFHVVFTLPPEAAQVAFGNKAVVYDLLFRCAAQTLLEVAADPKHLGANIGVLAVLHTWGQNLHHHPHVHCVVPGGGLSDDESQWIACRDNFFLPVKVLSRKFRGKFLAHLRGAYQRGELTFVGSLAALSDPDRFQQLLDGAYRREWVVYSKPPFGGPEQVLKYLARYTHRVAISNRRILSVDEQGVTFRYQDYAAGGAWRTMTLSGAEFLRRFLQHLVPANFVRIRSYGLLANRHRSAKLARCRELLAQQTKLHEVFDAPLCERGLPDPSLTAEEPSFTQPCPCCGGPMRQVQERSRPQREAFFQRPWPWDTS